MIVHQPGYVSTSRRVTAKLSSVPSGSNPWISAVTDGGGFRQFESTSGLVLAPGMIVSVFGLNLAAETIAATSLPLPTALGDARIEARTSSQSTWTSMPLFYASPGQVNALIPPEILGEAESTNLSIRAVRGNANSSSQWTVPIRPYSASLFSADSSGLGAVAGFFVRVLPDDTQQRGGLANCSSAGCAVNPVAFGGPANRLFLELFGTGFRNASAPDSLRVYIGGKPAEIDYAGPHPQFIGLDQLNVKVPADIARGEALDLTVWVKNEGQAWQASNQLTVRFE